MPTNDSLTIEQFNANLGLAIQQIEKPRLDVVLKSFEVATLGDVKQNFQQGMDPLGVKWQPLKHPRPQGGNKVLLSSGVLMNSIKVKATGSQIIQSTNIPYAGIHLFGGVIKPKRAKLLAIPLTKEASRYRPRKFPRSNNLFAIYGGSGEGVLLERRGGKEIAQYALVKEVRIPARPFLGFGPRLMRTLEAIAVGEQIKVVDTIVMPRGSFRVM